MRRVCAHVVLMWALVPLSGWAQTSSANLAGTVKDTSGGVLPGVAITARNVATNDTRTTVTAEDGLYRLTNLSRKTYEVTAELQGFSPLTQASACDATVPPGGAMVANTCGNVTYSGAGTEVPANLLRKSTNPPPNCLTSVNKWPSPPMFRAVTLLPLRTWASSGSNSQSSTCFSAVSSARNYCSGVSPWPTEPMPACVNIAAGG